MEKILFQYKYEDPDTSEDTLVQISRKNEDGLQCDELCGAFIEFISRAGFSEEFARDYFRRC